VRLRELAGGTEAFYVVADGAEADFKIAGDGVLALAFLEHGENLAAQFGGMSRERPEGKRKFGLSRTLGHRNEGTLSRVQGFGNILMVCSQVSTRLGQAVTGSAVRRRPYPCPPWA
jgi:hypothetical protein